ncbi:MAG: ribosome silencing factor [Clostridia bacterium]|nr:ribosome silencing factor [Clostridia bacterium]
MTPKELALKTAEILDNKKAEDIKVIEVTEQTIVADYFVLATGTSSTHVKALADDVEYELEQIGVHDGHIEGRATGWVLLDYGAVLVHVFDKESRAYYNLERLWTDANLVDLSGILKD